jgi:hypothetical protein
VRTEQQSKKEPNGLSKNLPDGRIIEYPHSWYRFKRNAIQIRVNTKQSNRRVAEELESAHTTRLAKGEAGLRDYRDVPTLKQFEKRFMEEIETRRAENLAPSPSIVRKWRRCWRLRRSPMLALTASMNQ